MPIHDLRECYSRADASFPITAIWGDRDHVTPMPGVTKVRQVLRRADVHILQDVGHLPHHERFEETAAILLKHLGLQQPRQRTRRLVEKTMPAELSNLKNECCATVDGLAAQLIEISHRIHATPELAFNEHQAASLLAETARAAGLDVEQGAFGLETAFSAEFGQPNGPCVAIMSEYDALPEVGHACGHNVIAAIGLGVTLALHALGQRMPGSVRYLGTPAEERGCGKELMARRGAFDGVDAAMMLHPACVETKAIRSICISEVYATFTGRSGHPALGTGTLRMQSMPQW